MLDLYRMLLTKKFVGGGGGGDITLETLNVSSNGMTNAPSGTAYNKVVANVANSYSAGDEGKVVSGGSLVSQTAHAQVTQNGTIDTTLNNSVEVAVPVPTLESKSISANGTYTPAVGKAWNEVIVSVPALESVSGTFTPVSHTGSMPIITHNLGTYDIFVFVYVDSDNYASLESGGYAGGTHSPVKIVAAIGNLNKDSEVKTLSALRLSASNSIGAYTTSIVTWGTTTNTVAFSTPNATYWRAGITYKYTVVKYGENTTEMGD